MSTEISSVVALPSSFGVLFAWENFAWREKLKMTVSIQLTVMLSCMAKHATLASNSGSCCASLSALAALALPMLPKHTVATSNRFVFTHMRAMFSQTDSLWQKRKIHSWSNSFISGSVKNCTLRLTLAANVQDDEYFCVNCMWSLHEYFQKGNF